MGEIRGMRLWLAVLVGFYLGESALAETWKAEDVGELGDGGGKLSALLNSDKLLPETPEQKDKAYATNFILTTYSSEDYDGKPLATKAFRGCRNTPDMHQCPKDIWASGYVRKKTEKKSDEAFSQNWSWGVYDGQFVLRYHTGTEPWKATEVGKSIGMRDAETCFTWTQDIKSVMLLQRLNAPSCKPVNNFGGAEKGKVDNGQAFLTTSGSFKIVAA